MKRGGKPSPLWICVGQDCRTRWRTPSFGFRATG